MTWTVSLVDQEQDPDRVQPPLLEAIGVSRDQALTAFGVAAVDLLDDPALAWTLNAIGRLARKTEIVETASDVHGLCLGVIEDRE